MTMEEGKRIELMVGKGTRKIEMTLGKGLLNGTGVRPPGSWVPENPGRGPRSVSSFEGVTAHYLRLYPGNYGCQVGERDGQRVVGNAASGSQDPGSFSSYPLRSLEMETRCERLH